MIVVRDVFQVKFGRMREAKELWKEALKKSVLQGAAKPRLLTDVTGPYYTLVLENTYKDLSDYEAAQRTTMSQPEMGAFYQKFVPLVDSGRREIFSIVES